jgi:branched-chain amino acid transport system ATP-binding protein
MEPYQITRRGIARTFQNIRIFKEMSVLENVLVAIGQQDQYATSRVHLLYRGFAEMDQREKEIARELLRRLSLLDKADLPAGALSYGAQRRLEIARALATSPRLLLLDEPAAGMNTPEKQQLMEEVIKLHKSGLSILLIEHDMSLVMGICEQVIVMNFGRVIAVGTPKQIRDNPQVIEAYLGQNGDPEAPTSLD